MDLSHVTALITGSTDGVGRLVAHRLAAAGARVLVHGRSDSKGHMTLREIQREMPHARSEYHRADFSQLSEVNRLVDCIS